MPDEKNTADIDYVERDRDEINMAKRIDEWNDPVETRDMAQLWFGLFILFLIWISGIIVGAYIMGWRV